MAGSKFEYDESGKTSLYFALSFLFVILIIGTYYAWRRVSKQSGKKLRCRCKGCAQKNERLRPAEDSKRRKHILICTLLALVWFAFFALVYYVNQFEYEYVNFDPYEILQLDEGSSLAAIKKSYRRLSLIYHPDRETGDEKKFVKLTKAYQALTDEEARHNWELYGNPDGPGAKTFGIALPSWIVEKQNSIWVLGLYTLVFMIGLPTAVGVWWYNSMRYSGDQVLLITTQLFNFCFDKTPFISVKRAVMILAASFEFCPAYNNEVVSRETDGPELAALIKRLTSNLGEKGKERPFCAQYSVKARALLHAHFSRIELDKESMLEADRLMILNKCSLLIQEMISSVSNTMFRARWRRAVCPVIVKGKWWDNLNYLDLPYALQIMLADLATKRKKIRSVKELLRVKEVQRRDLLRKLTKQEYDFIMEVCSSKRCHNVSLDSTPEGNCLPELRTMENCMLLSQMIVQAVWDNTPMLQLPYVTEKMLADFVVNRRTIGSIHQFMQLKETERRDLLEDLDDQEYSDVMETCGAFPHVEMEATPEVVDDEAPNDFTAGAMVTMTVKLTRSSLKGFGTKDQDEVADDGDKPEEEGKEVEVTTKKQTKWQSKAKKKITKKGGNRKAGKKGMKATENVPEESEEEEEKKEVEAADGRESGSEGEEKERDVTSDEKHDDWEDFRHVTPKKEKALEGKSKLSHPVHCPFFPNDKQEYWWVYICDRKNQMLLTSPVLVTDLVTTKEIEIHFNVPSEPGQYTYSVCLKSDSYLGFDQVNDLQFDVKEAKEEEDHPQWDFSDEEEEQEEDKEEDIGYDSEFATDSE